MTIGFIIFDVETNGLAAGRHSVLSFSALHVRTWRASGYRHFDVQKAFNRFYFPMEPYNPPAIHVNGLTRDVIEKRRQQSGDAYPLYFIQDPDVPEFCRKSNLAVCHNTPFDARFLKIAHGHEFHRTFCTMRNFTHYCAIPHAHFGVKWPKLEEAVKIICQKDDFAFHDSLADCYAVLEILKVMGNSEAYNGRKTWADVFDSFFS